MNMWICDFLFDMQQQGRIIYQKDIEAEFSINRATASKMLSLMENKKLIKRINDSSDSRLKHIVLESRGMELQKLCCYIRAEIESMLTEGFSEEEIKVFKSFCFRMLEHM